MMRQGKRFTFRFAIAAGRAYDFDVVPLSEAEARSWLERDYDAYRRHFGEPEVA